MADIDDALTSVLAACVPGFERLTSATRLSGGASQETYRIDLEASGAPLTLAMRRAAGGVTEPEPGRPGLEVEAELFRIARGVGVPEPEIVQVLTPADGLGAGFIMEWLDGETLGANAQSDFFAEYMAAAMPLLAGEPTVAMAEPRWSTGV